MFCRNTWYNKENNEKFKDNYISWCKMNDDNSNSNELINIQSYINKNNILKIFFDLFEIGRSEMKSKNIVLFER